MNQLTFPGLNLYCTDPAQRLIAAGEDLDYLSVDDISVDDLSDLCHVRVNAERNLIRNERSTFSARSGWLTVNQPSIEQTNADTPHPLGL